MAREIRREELKYYLGSNDGGGFPSRWYLNDESGKCVAIFYCEKLATEVLRMLWEKNKNENVTSRT